MTAHYATGALFFVFAQRYFKLIFDELRLLIFGGGGGSGVAYVEQH